MASCGFATMIRAAAVVASSANSGAMSTVLARVRAYSGAYRALARKLRSDSVARSSGASARTSARASPFSVPPTSPAMSKAVRVRTPSPLVVSLFSSDEATTLRLRPSHSGWRRTRTGWRLRAVRLRARRRRRGDRLEPRDDLLRNVVITVRRDDHARLGPRIQNERVAVFLPNVVQDLADLIHDRLDELHLPLLHLLVE